MRLEHVGNTVDQWPVDACRSQQKKAGLLQVCSADLGGNTSRLGDLCDASAAGANSPRGLVGSLQQNRPVLPICPVFCGGIQAHVSLKPSHGALKDWFSFGSLFGSLGQAQKPRLAGQCRRGGTERVWVEREAVLGRG